MNELVTYWTGVMLLKRECQPDGTYRMIKRDQLNPRRSKDRVGESLFILLETLRFSFTPNGNLGKFLCYKIYIFNRELFMPHDFKTVKNAALRDRSLFIPQGGYRREIKKSINKKITQPLWVFKFFLPTSNRNPRFKSCLCKLNSK